MESGYELLVVVGLGYLYGTLFRDLADAVGEVVLGAGERIANNHVRNGVVLAIQQVLNLCGRYCHSCQH